MILKNDQIKKIMDRMAELEVQSRDTYKIDEKRVPRVTEVLSAMIHEESLMSWANSLGWKRIGYRTFMNEASSKGTYSHLAVEKYIKEGSVNIDEFNIVNIKTRNAVESCLDAFKKWWNKIHLLYKEIEVIYLEESMIHHYFGGTCDCLLKVDGKYWLVDFKTSNHMNYNYSLQLAAYRFLLRELKNINVDRLIVLRLDKQNHEYYTYELDLSKKDHLSFVEDCEQTFMLMVAAYKMRLYTTDQYYNIYGIEKYEKKNRK